jgi:hypothetical protein
MFALEIDKEAADVAKTYYEKIIIGDVEKEDVLNQLLTVNYLTISYV